MTKCVLPWYNRSGWLGVKHQFTFLLCWTLFPTDIRPWCAEERWPVDFVLTDGIWHRRVQERNGGYWGPVQQGNVCCWFADRLKASGVEQKMKSKPSFNQLKTTRRLCCGFPKAAQGRQTSMFWSAVYDGWVGWGWVGEFLVEGGEAKRNLQ